jgi:transcriptional regulator with XRE-family HTH domain
MEDRLGALIRAVRRRRGMRQEDLARLAGVSHSTVSLVERGHWQKLSLATLRAIAAAVDVRVDLMGRWRGGDADRLLNRRHSLLAESVVASLTALPGWIVEAEVSFAIYGERGVVDLLAWHGASSQLLAIELKTEFVDVNELIGTLDRKVRLAGAIASSRGWRPRHVSAWLIVSDTRTNRRHFGQHATLLRGRFPMDGRQLRGFLAKPGQSAWGLSFWPDSNPGGTGSDNDRTRTRIRAAKGRELRVGALGRGGIRPPCP